MQRVLLSLFASTFAALSGIAQEPKLPVPAHVVIVIEENKNFGDIIGSPHAPYLNSLASRGALLANFFALHHPSQPNYVAFFAGDTLGVCDDRCRDEPFTARNLASALAEKEKTFVGYAENLPAHANSVCKSGKFARKHCPWLDFSNVPASASKSTADFPTDAAGFASLPTVSFVIPNLMNDMHSGPSTAEEIEAGDRWLKKHLDAYATWAESNNSLLILTWDEDRSSYTIHCPSIITTAPPKNHIATIVVGEPVAAGTASTKTYTHQDLLRTILDMYGIAPFGGATDGIDIEDIWRSGNVAEAATLHQSVAPLLARAVVGTPGSKSSSGCGDGLWFHVYHPDRLLVKQDCITVTGTIVDATANQIVHHNDGLRHELDGDTHGWLKVDPEFEGLLNKGNLRREKGNLVFEVVCHFAALRPSARPACTNFHDTMTIPPVGTHVAITGTFVQDTNHGEWNEIHPVSKIEMR